MAYARQEALEAVAALPLVSDPMPHAEILRKIERPLGHAVFCSLASCKVVTSSSSSANFRAALAEIGRSCRDIFSARKASSQRSVAESKRLVHRESMAQRKQDQLLLAGWRFAAK